MITLSQAAKIEIEKAMVHKWEVSPDNTIPFLKVFWHLGLEGPGNTFIIKDRDDHVFTGSDYTTLVGAVLDEGVLENKLVDDNIIDGTVDV